MSLRLIPEEIIATARILELRIQERFPKARLCRVAREVVVEAEQARARSLEISRPHQGLRAARILLLLCMGGVLLTVFMTLNPLAELREWSGVKELISILEPALGTGVFLGAFVVFVWTLEDRWKREKALEALHELRQLAHVVDIHQLTKDPVHVLCEIPSTAHSPVREMSAVELGRYFDYCSELLSIISKIAAIYAQELADPTALKGVDEIESLVSGLSRKVWQKMALLPQFERIAAATEPLPLYNRPLPRPEPVVPTIQGKTVEPTENEAD